MIADNDFDTLNPQQLRQALRAAQAQVAVKSELVARHERTVAFKQAVIDKLTHEMTVLKRLKFAATSERFSPEQKSLLEEAIDEDLEALAREVERWVPAAKDGAEKRQPKRQALPGDLPRREVRHEPQTTTCGCGCGGELKRIGEDVAEKLDYAPGTFTVERHVRGKWTCTQCRTLVQAPVPAHVIDKGLATAGLMAHVTVAKYIDHQPLYRQEHILGRAGYAVPRSTQAEWIGAIEACSWRRWCRPCMRTCSAGACCMPTRRRWRCSSPDWARRTGLTCGATAPRSGTTSMRWCSTLPRAARDVMRASSSASMRTAAVVGAAR